MEAWKILESLENIADKLDIEIVYEQVSSDEFLSNGGICKLKGQYKIFIDPYEPLKKKIAILVRALSSFDTEHIYMPPFIRETLEVAKNDTW